MVSEFGYDEKLFYNIILFQLYPPGKLLHFAFDPVTHEAQPNWIKHDYLKDVQLTGSIIADHMPFRVRKLLRKARDEHVYV